MITQNVDTARPASGGLLCTCEGEVCEPWCVCNDCDSRPDKACLLEVGTTFTEILCELLLTLSDDKCGDLVFTRAHQDGDRLHLVFDTAPEKPPATTPARPG